MTKKKNIKSMNLREKDPYLEREYQKYATPLPSREWIIEILERAGVPQKITALAEQLSISDEEFEFFERRLKAMARDGQILINRRNLVCVAEKLDIVKCRVEMQKDGFGFAVPLKPTGEKDFVLYERQLYGVMNGDIVTVRPLGLDRRGRREGQVLDIVERGQSSLVGRFYLDHGVAVLEPEDKRLHQNVILEPASVAQFQPESGQVVVAEIESYPENHRPAVAKITEILGDYADSGMEIEIALRKHKLPYEFSAGCLQAAAKIPDTVRAADRKNRVDLRDLPLVTIDGETSRDFDDAVYAEKIGRNYRLVVAIADVSHYVRPDDAIDTDAKERARHQRLFPAPRHPHAAGSLVQRHLLAESERGTAVHGVRYDDYLCRQREIVRVLSGRDEIARAADIQPSVGLAGKFGGQRIQKQPAHPVQALPSFAEKPPQTWRNGI